MLEIITFLALLCTIVLLTSFTSKLHNCDICIGFNNDFSYENTWLEVKNTSGNPGSLLGEEIYMAFETKDNWIISKREILLENLRRKIIDKTRILNGRRRIFYDL